MSAGVGPDSKSGLSALEVARRCAAEAARLMREGFGRTEVSSVKGRGNVLTEVDLAVERSTMAILGEEYPGMVVMSEESTPEVRSDGWMWVVDPLDGTKNFSRGIPHFCYTIALCGEGEPVVGLTLQPLLEEEFVAVRGQGARLNGQRMTASALSTVREGVVAIDLGYDDAMGRRQLELALRLWPGMESLRLAGSAALGLAYVAAGRYDLLVHEQLSPWDLAAGLLMVREAGGVVTDADGRPATTYSGGIIAAGPGVHMDFMRLAVAERARTDNRRPREDS